MNSQNSDSDPTYKTKEREQVIEMYKEAVAKDLIHKYQKIAKVLARPAIEGEEIITSIEGEDRTKNRAKAGDYVVKNPAGEEYLVSKEKFHQRYELIGEGPQGSDYKEYQAVGIVWGFPYEGPDLKIEAPWGEQQIVKSGDMIVSLKKDDYDDIYGVEKEIFKETYEKIQD